MENKEYKENQKVQRKEFKKYRKHMIKMVVSLLFAVASAFIFPEHVFGFVFQFLKKFISEYLAGSIVFWAQVLCMSGGVLGGIYHAFKASQAKNAVDKAQDEEEDIVDSLITEKDNLLRKVDELSKEKEKIMTENKSYTNTKDYSKTSREFVEEKPKTKKIGSR